MEIERFQRAERLFQEAVVLPPEQRREHVEAAAQGDADLAARVCRMLKYADQAASTEDFLHVDSPEIARGRDAAQLIGQTIGPYRITGVIGEGGFGRVFRAEQDRPVRRSVALKLLKGGMDSQQVMARFDAERQALALMEHPGIARVIDAGQTDALHGARPYFVMELVSGEPITTYCDRKALDVPSRLKLFITVCQAVQHAHQKGIIHRDLKPSNILVTEVDGVAAPKVIDFGIAKAIYQPLTDAMLVTNRMELLGTPQYMSPEQVDAGERAIDTRTDVYSLGVLLYELLTGTTPLEEQELWSASYSRMLRAIVEQQIERPSIRLSRSNREASANASRRGLDARSLCRQVRGELDWISLKALDSDRERRYDSAAALAQDIDRFLRHEPVLAGPPSASYRLRKFVRRHRIGVAAAAIVALAVIGGSVVATVSLVQVRNSANQALAVNQFMAEVLTSANPAQDGADVRLVEVLRAASNSVPERFADYPELEAQVRELLGRVFQSLTMPSDAASEFERAAAIMQSLHGADDPRTLSAHTLYAQSLYWAERTRQCETVLADLLPRIERRLSPDHPTAMHANCIWSNVQMRRGRFDESERVLQDIRKRIATGAVNDWLHVQVLDALLYLMWLRWDTMGQAHENHRIVDEMEEVALELEACASLSPEFTLAAVRAQIMQARVSLLRGDPTAAAERGRVLLDESRQRLGECHGHRLMIMSTLASALQRMGDTAGAADLHLREIECVRAADNMKIVLVSSISDALPTLDHGGRWTEGEALAREFVSEMQDFGGGHDDMLFDGELYIARFVSLQSRLDEAESLFNALLLRQDEVIYPRSRARLHLFHGSHLLQRQLYEQAEQSLVLALAQLEDIRIGTTEDFPEDLIQEFIALYQAWGKPERVAEYERLLGEAAASSRGPQTAHE